MYIVVLCPEIKMRVGKTLFYRGDSYGTWLYLLAGGEDDPEFVSHLVMGEWEKLFVLSVSVVYSRGY
jgi:hypothetical protein